MVPLFPFPFGTLQQGNRKQGYPTLPFQRFHLFREFFASADAVHFPARFFWNVLWMVNVKQPWTSRKGGSVLSRAIMALGPKCGLLRGDLWHDWSLVKLWPTQNATDCFRPRSHLLHTQPWALRRYFRAVLLKGSLIISPFSKLWGLDRPKKEWMLPTTKDADHPQGSGVLEKDTNVADNGGPRKKRRLSRNGTCITLTGDPLQSELNFHPHKKQKTLFNVGEVENVASTMAEPQRKANFSAYGNHFHERSPLANNSAKPGQTKKLVIKNFKGGSF